MINGLAAQGRLLARKGIYVQILVSFLLCICVTVLHPSVSAAVIMGCLSFVVPHTIFAYWLFRFAGASKNNLVAQSLSQGMKIKLILTSVFFIVALAVL